VRKRKLSKLVGPALLAIWMLFAVTPSAQAAASDPLFVFTPTPSFAVLPPPSGYLEGPCGMGVDPTGRFYVSDYYHDTVDAYDQNANYIPPPPPAKPPTGATGYLGQLAGVDSVDGPCALSFDASGRLYVNDYHRAVKRYGPLGSFGSPTTITGATTPEGTHPTGVAVDPATGNVYVDQRTHVSVFDESGAPVMTGLPGSEVPLQIGNGPLKDGYGIAFSSYPGTQGYLYVPDAATNTIEVYDTANPEAGPVETIDGSETPKGKFVSLRDASIAVDRVTGEIYVVDDLQPEHTESPQAIVYVFHSDGTYEGHLKFLVTWGMPSGLAVDNSQTATQGRVYLTSGNTAFGLIYAYGPGAATTAAIALPSAVAPTGEAGAPEGEAGSGCPTCEKEATEGAVLSQSATAPGQSLAPSAPSTTATQNRKSLSPSRRRAHRRQAHHKAHHHRQRAHRSHPRRVPADR
jgi:DNA-binding beta-propeller fold protein YncE